MLIQGDADIPQYCVCWQTDTKARDALRIPREKTMRFVVRVLVAVSERDMGCFGSRVYRRTPQGD